MRTQNEKTINSTGFWKPILVLAKIRFTIAANTFRRNPTAQMGFVVFFAVSVLCATGIGNTVLKEWRTLPSTEGVAALEATLVVVQIVLMLACIAPGSISLLGPLPPETVLRAFSLTKLQRTVADLVTCLLDVPLVLAVVVALPLIQDFCFGSRRLAAIYLFVSVLILGILSALTVRSVIHVSRLISTRLAGGSEPAKLTALLFVLFTVTTPPAFAALTSPKIAGSNHPTLQSLGRMSVFRQHSPARLLAESISIAATENSSRTVGKLAEVGLMSTGMLLFTLAAGGASLSAPSRTSNPAPQKSRLSRVSADLRLPPALNTLWALVVTDIKVLLRDPIQFVGLRRPAAMVLAGCFAMLAPDMGKNPVYNTRELLALGGVLFPIMWQVQLLCNRFGSDAGKAAMLFGYSLDRRLLIVGKNISLALVLFVLDAAAMMGVTAVIGEPGALKSVIIRLPVLLIIATSLGNVISVLQPYPLRALHGSGNEPIDGLAGAFLGVIIFCAIVTFWMLPLSGGSGSGEFAGILSLGALYTASVLVAARLVKRGEQLIIAKLDGGN